MRKELLIRHIQGNVDSGEREAVEMWLKKSAQNRQYYKNLKNVWVSQTLPQEEVAGTELLRGMNDLKGRLAQKQNLRFKKYFFASLAATGAAVLVLGLMVWRYEFAAPDPLENRVLLASLPQEYKHVLYTDNGIKARLILPDSSQVWLNSGSEIIYPDRFSGSTREIKFRGEGYFKVKSDSLHPMIITTNKDFRIEVTGTEFNVKSYEDDSMAQATLYSGRISLISKGKGVGKEMKMEMKPFQTCIIEANKIVHISPMVSKVAENTKAWKEGRLIFSDTPMQEVVKILRRWHGVEIEVADAKILDYKITADFNSESMVQIANILKFCALVDYKEKGGKFIFFGR